MNRKKVVIVDDEKDLCHLLRQYLTEMSPEIEVHLAYNLTDGMHVISTVAPDVVFMDNNLPDGLGWEKLQDVHSKFPSCKLNLITASQYLPGDLAGKSYPLQVIEKPLRLNLLKEYI